MDKFSNLRTIPQSVSDDLHFELVFKDSKDKKKIKGFKLYGLGQFESESFAITFARASQIGNADISYKDGKIAFKHGGVSLKEADKSHDVFGVNSGGIYSADLEESFWSDVEKLLSGKYEGEQVSLTYQFGFHKGFYFGI